MPETDQLVNTARVRLAELVQSESTSVTVEFYTRVATLCELAARDADTATWAARQHRIIQAIGAGYAATAP
jgi:hypothetical protein